MSDRVSFTCNDAPVYVEVATDESLLSVLRERLGILSPKDGCAPQGQCGCCTVLVDGAARVACVTPAVRVAGRVITTLEGLGSANKLHALQKAFIEEQAAQCGFCISGMIMTAKAFLDRVPNPSENQIREAMANNLCRCGTHSRIVSAIARAARELA